MVLRLAWVVLLTGCAASSGRHEFRDGAPVRAAPAEPHTIYTPAGAGLPEYWGTPESKPELSPYTRVLPPTKEQGLWSGDSPKASLFPSIEVLGINVPMPDTFRSHSNPAINCATAVASGIRLGNRLEEAFRALTIEDRLCFITSAMMACMELRSLLLEKREKAEEGDLALLAKVRFDTDAVRARLQKHASLVCWDGASAPVKDLLDRWQPIGLVPKDQQ